MKKIAFILSLAAVSTVLAARIDENTARAAAAAFVTSDGVGAVVLRGRTAGTPYDRDGLWIVPLDPAGHVILSGSDLVDPIVGFSKTDFTEPDPESPAYAALAAAAEASRATEASGRAERHAKWNKLLATGGKPRLSASTIENPQTIVVEPFLKTHWNQWQPYNDYAPLYDVSASESGYWPYRGRCACGCVATAASQILYYFKWPARIDNTISCNHLFTSNNINAYFPIRFDGHNPIYWQGLVTNYVHYNGGYDLRGKVAESVRQPIARLVLWADELAQMSFGDKAAGGSGANYGTVSGNLSDWYTPARKISVSSTTDTSEALSCLQAGIPLSVTIPGHAVVAHGWASDSGSAYLYLNYGWGGDNDGYYNLPSQADSSSVIQEIYVGHYPRAKPQIDPLPKVCETSLTLNWHFPDFYTNNLSGFTVTASRTATTPSTFLDDFSASTGVSSSSEGIYITTDSVGNDGSLLFTKPTTSGTYTFPDSYTLTSASVLTFKLYSFAALGAVYQVEARFNGGDWTPLCTPTLKTDWGASGWSTERVYLGSRGGQTAQFRIRNGRNSGSYYSQDQSRILLDDFCVTDVLAPVAPEIQSVGKSARSLTLNGLAAGATYSFTVTPNISGALVSGETSEPASTSIAGSRNTPIPGEQTFTTSTLTFSASDTSGTWSYSHDSYGNIVDDSSVKGILSCSITAKLSGEITTASILSFQWSVSNYPENSVNSWSAVFIDGSGTETSLGGGSSSSDVSMQNVNLSLSGFAGQSGTIRISYSHDSGSAWTSSSGILHAPSISNVRVPSVPAVAWNTETLTALGTPEIRSVSNVTEGFYGDCGLDSTTFTVTCSESVTQLFALPSHLSLVRDEDVTVTPKGNGRFSVSVRPSGVTEDNARSRMILTLAATDTNGTTVYKDLSLRFEKKEAPASVTVNAESASGAGITVSIPYTWFVESGLAESGASAEELESLAEADSDGDGQPNWFEYICQTDPSDGTKKLTCHIEVVNGQGKVTYEPSELRAGFQAVIKGTDDLRAVEWTTVTTETSSLHFFTVVIENE